MTDFEFPPLFKFRSLDKGSMKYTLKGIEDNEIWFAGINSLNDPFEMYYSVNIGVREENIQDFFLLLLEVFNDREKYSNFDISALPFNETFIRMILQQIPAFTSDIRAQITKGIEEKLPLIQLHGIKKIKNDTKLFCCSKVDSHPLLWGHYADGMRGICIEYNFNNQLRDPYFGFCEVDYQGSPLSINFLNFIKQNQVMDDYSERIFGTKNNAWVYENEFRLIASNDHWEGNKYKLSDNVIRSITIGEFIRPEPLKELLRAVEGKDIELKIALAKPETFSTETIPFESSFFDKKYL